MCPALLEAIHTVPTVWLLEGGLQIVDEPEDLLVVLDCLLNLVVGVKDSRVITIAEELTDAGERVVGQLARQLDGDLARPGDILGALLADDVLGRTVKFGGHVVKDVLEGDAAVGVRG